MEKNKNMIYLGVDPGKSGAIAIITSDDIKTFNLDNTEADIGTFLRKIVEMHDRMSFAIERIITPCTHISCLIEKQWSRPGQSATSMDKLLKNYGFLRGLLTAYKIPFNEISAIRWQKYFNFKTTTSKDGKTKHKNELKGRAQQIFPNMKVTLANADALLISYYLKETSK